MRTAKRKTNTETAAHFPANKIATFQPVGMQVSIFPHLRTSNTQYNSHMHTHTYLNYTYSHAHSFTSTHTVMYVHMHTILPVFITHMYTTQTHIHNAYTNIHTYSHLYSYTLTQRTSLYSHDVYTNIHILTCRPANKLTVSGNRFALVAAINGWHVCKHTNHSHVHTYIATHINGLKGMTHIQLV